MIKDKFEIELLDEAREFLCSIDEKARIKFLFIIDNPKNTMTQQRLKN
jgi:hypothetical protein